jgi:hypothetical protein
VFHGLDVVIILALLVAAGLYIYRHVKADRAATSQSGDGNDQPTMPMRRV